MQIVKLEWGCNVEKPQNDTSVEILIFSLKFDQSYPFTRMTQKVCQNSAIYTENSKILSRVKALD